jgi:hypothetical protein
VTRPDHGIGARWGWILLFALLGTVVVALAFFVEGQSPEQVLLQSILVNVGTGIGLAGPLAVVTPLFLKRKRERQQADVHAQDQGTPVALRPRRRARSSLGWSWRDRLSWSWDFGDTYGLRFELLYAVGLPVVTVGSAVLAGWAFGYAPGPFASFPLAMLAVALAYAINIVCFLGLGFHWWNGFMFLSQLLIYICAATLGNGIADSALGTVGEVDTCTVESLVERVVENENGGSTSTWNHLVSCPVADIDVVEADAVQATEGEDIEILYDPRDRISAMPIDEVPDADDLKWWWVAIAGYTGIRVVYALWNTRGGRR